MSCEIGVWFREGMIWPHGQIVLSLWFPITSWKCPVSELDCSHWIIFIMTVFNTGAHDFLLPPINDPCLNQIIPMISHWITAPPVYILSLNQIVPVTFGWIKSPQFLLFGWTWIASCLARSPIPVVYCHKWITWLKCTFISFFLFFNYFVFNKFLMVNATWQKCLNFLGLFKQFLHNYFSF